MGSRWVDGRAVRVVARWVAAGLESVEAAVAER
jgi:hypothetical protein